ncbi:MAG TPA: hypothetical protein V6C69_09600, partial [Trichormus sp.]
MTIERDDFFDFFAGGELSNRLVPIVSALDRPFDTGIETASARAGGANDTAAQDASATMDSITRRDGSFKFARPCCQQIVSILPAKWIITVQLASRQYQRICSVMTIASVHETPGKLG